MTTDATLRTARSDEARQLTAIAIESKQHWGYPDDLIELWMEDLEFTPESIDAHTVVVAERRDELLGVVAISRSDESAELDGLWVRPSSMGEGLGRALFHRALEAATQLGATSLIIDADPHAEKFYLHMGAKPTGSVPSTPAGRRLPRLIYGL
jgi:GNAT superfamily N-acetyltransferase